MSWLSAKNVLQERHAYIRTMVPFRVLGEMFDSSCHFTCPVHLHTGVPQGVPGTLIPNCIGLVHGQILIVTETHSWNSWHGMSPLGVPYISEWWSFVGNVKPVFLTLLLYNSVILCQANCQLCVGDIISTVFVYFWQKISDSDLKCNGPILKVNYNMNAIREPPEPMGEDVECSETEYWHPLNLPP